MHALLPGLSLRFRLYGNAGRPMYVLDEREAVSELI
jgi:hypothetical protein